MKDKIRVFFAKLNNTYVLVAICVILIGMIALGALVNLVAQPFCKNTTYSTKFMTEHNTVYRKASLVLLESGRYSLTVVDVLEKEEYTVFGDYNYGRVHVRDDDYKKLHNVIWFDRQEFSAFDSSLYVLKSPFKLEYEGVEFTNVGGIALLVLDCVVVAAASAIATVLLVKRRKGKVIFTDRLGIFRRII